MNDKLDRLLQDWAAQTRWPENRRRQVEAKIAQEVRRQARLGSSPEPRATAPGFGIRLAYLACGAAVALLAVCAARHFLPAARNGERIEPSLAAANRVKSMSVLFDEANRLFDGELRWIAQTGSDVKMEINPPRIGVSRDPEAFAVAIAVVARPVGQTQWRPVWETRVVTRPQDWIETALDAKSENRLRLWLLPLPDGRIALESGLTLNVPFQFRTQTSEILEDGQPCRVISITQGGTEYRIIQTVTRLGSPRKGGSTSC